jgi:hypothetical protein
MDRKKFHSMRDEEAPNIDEKERILDEGIEVDIMLNEGLKGDWNKFMEDASKPMYGACKLSNLTTILLILNL